VIVYVVTHAPLGAELEEILGVTTSEEKGRELAEKDHDKHRDHKVTGPLHWDEHGVSWSVARGRRYSGHYSVDEFPVL
jgi:hypothetical protein